MKIIISLLVVCLLAGCATTQQAYDSLNQRYVGTNTDAFFLAHGVPRGSFRLHNGNTVYVWQSNIAGIAMPSVTTASGNISPNGYLNATAETTGGGIASLFCRLNIVATPDGTIQHIGIATDTVGAWNLSRCAEVFR